MKNSNQAKSPGCFIILFSIFVIIPLCAGMLLFALSLGAGALVHLNSMHILIPLLAALAAICIGIVVVRKKKQKEAEQNHIDTVLQQTVTYPDPIGDVKPVKSTPPDGLYEEDHLARLAADQAARDASNAHYQIAVIDFETTGLDCSTDEILQVSIIDECENVLMNQYCRAVRHSSWHKAAEVNGIYPSRVAFCPPFEAVAPYVQDILSRADMVLAYNYPFEPKFLRSNGIDPDALTWGPDPMREIAAYCNIGSGRMSLARAAEFIGYSYNPHDAAEDVKATLHVHKFLQEHKAKPPKPVPAPESPPKKKRSSRVLYPENKNADPRHSLYGKTIVITGSLPISREQASLQAAELGAKVRVRVGPRTQILVCGRREDEWATAYGEKSYKAKQVEKLNAEGASIQLMPGDEFMNLLQCPAGQT